MAAVEKVEISTVVTGDTPKTFRELRQSSKNLRDELATLTQGTQEYNDVLLKLRETESRINEINVTVAGTTANLTERISLATGALSGITAGFGAVTSAAALFGAQTDGLAETLVRVQAGLALTQQLQAFSTGIKTARVAMQAFTASLLANPLVAFVAAIVAAGVTLIALGNNLATAKSGVDDLRSSNEAFNKTLARQNDELDFNIRLLAAQGVTAEEQSLLRRRELREQISAREQLIDTYSEEIHQLESTFKPWFSGQRKRLKALYELRDEQASLIEEQYAQQSQLNNDFTVLEVTNDYRSKQERLKQEQEYLKRLQAERDKARAEEEKAEADFYAQRSATLQFFEQQRVAALNDSDRLRYIEDEIDLNRIRQKQLLEQANREDISYDLRNRAQAMYNQLLSDELQLTTQSETLRQQIAEAEQTQANAEAERLRQLTELEMALELARNPENLTYEEQIERYREQAAASWELANDESESYEVRIQAIEDYNKALQNSYNLEAKLASDKRKLNQAQLKATADFLSAAATLLGDNTVAGKAVAVAGATINTYLAGSQALAAYPPPTSYIALAATIATGLANVRNILSTQVPGASSDVSGGSATTALPAFPDLIDPIQETHNNYTAADEDFINANRPVLVVEDYKEARNRLDTAEINSTF